MPGLRRGFKIKWGFPKKETCEWRLVRKNPGSIFPPETVFDWGEKTRKEFIESLIQLHTRSTATTRSPTKEKHHDEDRGS